MNDHSYWMEQALVQARKARDLDEVPVGAVVVYEERLIGEGFNASILTSDPTAHAEIVALRQAANRLNNYRLTGSVLYVTLEPCAMCVAAACHARVEKVIFGASDERMGCLASNPILLTSNLLLRQLDFQGGIGATEARQLLRTFFRQKRTKEKGTSSLVTGMNNL